MSLGKSVSHPLGNKIIYEYPNAHSLVVKKSIDYKKIEPKRVHGYFDSMHQSRVDYGNIDQNGYISGLQKFIKKSNSVETIIINVGVGRGKTHSIYNC